jgi:molecular chaperone DnaK
VSANRERSNIVELDKFAYRIVRTKLVDIDELAGDRSRQRPNSANHFATFLVQLGKLTQFQADRLLGPQWRSVSLGNIVLQEKIGEGGMGEVFRAEHRRMKRPVVVKLLPAAAMESPILVKRFQREVEVAARLIHPHIVTAYDAGEKRGVHFLVMEYVDGWDLGTLVDQYGPMPLETAISCILQAARGLHFAHGCGVIHRDVKPGNLLLDRAKTVKILDMGLALFQDYYASNPIDELTEVDKIIGTVEYMSPEQADDSSAVDHRTDIYSLGCTFYRLLTGIPPFHRSTPLKTLLAHRADPIPSLRDTRPDVPPHLDTLFRRMVAKDALDRPSSMQVVINELEQFLEESDFEMGQWKWPQEGVLESVSNGRSGTNSQEQTRSSLEDPEATLPSRTPSRRRRTLPVGIDLGTTFSALAYLDELGRPQTVSNREGEKITPSMLLFEGEEVIVGREALRAISTDMALVAACPKRDIGARAYHRRVAEREYPPEVLQAWVLRKLVQDAQDQLGEFRRVVITVPAYFDEVRRKATQDAGEIAGLEVIDIINEPTAAALAFGYHQGLLKPEIGLAQPRNILVYDLGGGTFDVTVMTLQGRELRMLATDGDVRLGGLDWDQRLVDLVADQFLQQHGEDPRLDPNSLGRLWRDCEEAKRTLSARTQTKIVCHAAGQVSHVTVTRDEFVHRTRDLLDRTTFTTRHTLEASGLKWSDIDRVLLVGGATRMPQVREMLAEISGQEPDGSVSPDEAVAQGAAIHAHLVLSQRSGQGISWRVTNVNSHSLGVVASDPMRGQLQTAVLIPRNTPLPAKARRVFLTQKQGQRSILVQIVEGESLEPGECAPLGKCVVRGLPPELPKHTPVDVQFEYQENGRLQVDVSLPESRLSIAQEITRENSLTPAERQSWRELVCRHSSRPLGKDRLPPL